MPSGTLRRHTPVLTSPAAGCLKPPLFIAENERMKVKASLCAAVCALVFAVVLVQQAVCAPKVSAPRQKLITYALSFEGTKYVYGGVSPDTGFDCSGYVDYVVDRAAGIQLPRQAHAIWSSGKVKRISESFREPGDLIFFKNDMKAERVTHVGIYCGVYHGKRSEFEGRRVFISAVSDGDKTGVQLAPIDGSFWKTHLAGYGRILPSTFEGEVQSTP